MAVPSIKPRNNRGVILFGLSVGLLVGAGLTLAMLFWPLSIPAALVFVFSISPIFAWAQAYASMVAITATSVLMGVLATTAAKVLVTLYQGFAWGVGSILNLVMSPAKEIVAQTGVAKNVNVHHNNDSEGVFSKDLSNPKTVGSHAPLFNNSSHGVRTKEEVSNTAPRGRAKSCSLKPI